MKSDNKFINDKISQKIIELKKELIEYADMLKTNVPCFSNSDFELRLEIVARKQFKKNCTIVAKYHCDLTDKEEFKDDN